nr:hypothetical protein JVH1_4431 [Rhodococcus sp. JVH1]
MLFRDGTMPIGHATAEREGMTDVNSGRDEKNGLELGRCR